MKTKGMVSTAIAIGSGILVLGGYFIRVGVLAAVKDTLIRWAVILLAFAVLFGFVHLLIIHLNKITQKQKRASYSILVILAMTITFSLGIFSTHFPKVSSAFEFTFRAIQLPVEASLMALLAVTLTYACIRMLRRSLSTFSIIFIITILLVLLGTAPLPFLGDTPLISDTLRPFITGVLAASGARGILIGVALGALTTGLRILFGTDRPYKGK